MAAGQRLAMASTNQRGSGEEVINSATQNHGHHHPTHQEINNADHGAPTGFAAQVKWIGGISHGRTVWRSTSLDEQSCGNGHSCLRTEPLDHESLAEESVSSLISVVILVGLIRVLNTRFSSARLG